jgi:hypothetical protein
MYENVYPNLDLKALLEGTKALLPERSILTGLRNTCKRKGRSGQVD